MSPFLTSKFSTTLLTLSLLLSLLLSLAPALPPSPPNPPSPPSLYLWNSTHLSTLRRKVARHDPLPRPTSISLQHLRAATAADLTALQQWGMPAVTNKSAAPGAAGDAHYFTSTVPYAFPCNVLPPNCLGYKNVSHAHTECNTDGLPWKICDGQLNTAMHFPDRKALERMIHLVIRLSLSGYVLTDATRSAAAAELLKVWFLDPATRMHPSLRFAQGIPGVTEAKHSGCMDLYFFGRGFTDAVALLAQTPGSGAYLSTADRGRLDAWFADMASDMIRNPVINPEARMKNNHGVYYDLTVTSLALLAGDEDSLAIVRRISGGEGCWERGERHFCLAGRFESQIDPEGGFRYELHRADVGHYVWYTLLANTCLATFARRVGNDAGLTGGLIRAADWALAHALNPPDARIAGKHIYAVHAYRMLAVNTRDRRYEDMACEILKRLSGRWFWESEKIGTDVLELAIPPLDGKCEAWDKFLEEFPAEGLWKSRVSGGREKSALVDAQAGPGLFRERELGAIAVGDGNETIGRDVEVPDEAVWPFLVVPGVVFVMLHPLGLWRSVRRKVGHVGTGMLWKRVG